MHAVYEGWEAVTMVGIFVSRLFRHACAVLARQSEGAQGSSRETSV